MIVIDTSALTAVLRHKEAGAFLQIIVQARSCLLSAVSHLETSIVLAGRGGDRGAWGGLDALVRKARVQVVPHDAGLADVARESFLRFGRGRHPAALNFGDCAAYALAKTHDAPLLSKGDNFLFADVAGCV